MSSCRHINIWMVWASEANVRICDFLALGLGKQAEYSVWVQWAWAVRLGLSHWDAGACKFSSRRTSPTPSRKYLGPEGRGQLSGTEMRAVAWPQNICGIINICTKNCRFLLRYNIFSYFMFTSIHKIIEFSKRKVHFFQSFRSEKDSYKRVGSNCSLCKFKM